MKFFTTDLSYNSVRDKCVSYMFFPQTFFIWENNSLFKQYAVCCSGEAFCSILPDALTWKKYSNYVFPPWNHFHKMQPGGHVGECFGNCCEFKPFANEVLRWQPKPLAAWYILTRNISDLCANIVVIYYHWVRKHWIVVLTQYSALIVIFHYYNIL